MLLLTLLTLLLSQKNKYPWVAALLSNGGQFCGGTLVASKYVVTAAHCMFLDQDATQPVAAGDITVGLAETQSQEATQMLCVTHLHSLYQLLYIIS